MAKKRKKYLVTANESEALACSLVTNPAISELFVAFDEQEPLKVKFSDDSKHIVVGAVAIPNYEIYRRDDNGNEYDIVFSEEAIEKMSRDFLKNYRQKDVTLQHREEAEGIYLVEQWLKSDMVYDKSLALGLSDTLPKGTWFQAYYVDSNEIWERIQSDELRGFSLECALGLEEFNNQINENEMKIETNETFWDKVKSIVREALSCEKVEEPIQENVEVDLEEQTLTESVTEAPTAQETTVETPIVEEVVEPITEPTEEVVEAVNEPNPLEDVISNLKSELEALRKMNESLQTKLDDMGKQPSAQPINTNATTKSNDAYLNWRSQMAKML